MFDKKRREAINCIKNFALPKAKDGSTCCLGAVQVIFTFPKEKILKSEIAEMDEKLLSGISAKKLMILSETFRDYLHPWYHDLVIIEQQADWTQNISRRKLSFLNDSQYDAVLKLGTFVSNGYFRQSCMEQLAGKEGTLPFFILRMNDWVLPIRESAFLLAQQRLNECGTYELFFSCPMIEKVKISGRRNSDDICFLEQQAEQMMNQNLCQMTEEEIDKIHFYEPVVKNSVYRFINRHKTLARNQMERLLQLEKTGYGKRLLLSGIFHHYGYDREKAKEYLASKSAEVRYYTLIYRYETEQDAWDGMENMLLDPSKRIREYAVYILRKRKGLDVTAYYRNELDRQVSPTAILGIGENGTNKETEIIRPFLEYEDVKIKKAALIAYSKLEQASGAEIYWKFLLDSNLLFVRAAYRIIRKYDILYDASRLYEIFEQKRETPAGEYFFNLLVVKASWKRMPYLLKLYCDERIPEKWYGRIKMEKLLSGNLFAKISSQQAQEIRDVLERNKERIPQVMEKEILFALKYITE